MTSGPVPPSGWLVRRGGGLRGAEDCELRGALNSGSFFVWFANYAALLLTAGLAE